jgi:hypothetical protein
VGSKIEIVVGDTEEWLLTLETSTGLVDLSTGVDELAMFMWTARSRVSIIDGTTLAAGSTIGQVAYGPQSTEVDTVGEYFQVIRLTRTNGDVAHFPSGDDYNRVSISLGPPST